MNVFIQRFTKKAGKPIGKRWYLEPKGEGLTDKALFLKTAQECADEISKKFNQDYRVVIDLDCLFEDDEGDDNEH